MKTKLTSVLILLTIVGSLTSCRLTNPAAGIFHSSPSGREVPAPGIGNPPPSHDKLSVKMQGTVENTVQTTVRVFWLASVLSLLCAGGCLYIGQISAAIKLTIAALLLPAMAEFFSVFYGWIIFGVITSLSIYEIVLHWTVIKPMIARLESTLPKAP